MLLYQPKLSLAKLYAHVWFLLALLSQQTLALNIAVWIGGRIGCVSQHLLPKVEAYMRGHPGDVVHLYMATDPDMYERFRAFSPNASRVFAGVHLQSVEYPTPWVINDSWCKSLTPPASCEHSIRLATFNYRAFSMIQQAAITYDVVIKYRDDIEAPELPPVDAVNLDNFTIYVPQGSDYGPANTHLNDQLAHGSQEAMRKYAAARLDMPNYFVRDGVGITPECVVRHNADLQHLQVVRTNYIYKLSDDRHLSAGGCGVP